VFQAKFTLMAIYLDTDRLEQCLQSMEHLMSNKKQFDSAHTSKCVDMVIRLVKMEGLATAMYERILVMAGRFWGEGGVTKWIRETLATKIRGNQV
jgi:hypothetical protein